METARLKTNEEMNAEIPGGRAEFTEMSQATSEDYRHINAAEGLLESQLPDRLMAYLTALDISNGTPISILHHSLLTATLAAEDGRCDEYVACALVHDIGDLLSPADHGAFAAAIVRPYVSEAHWFMTRYHPEFQMAHQAANTLADPKLYLRHRDSPYFEFTQEFCLRYDQRAFDSSLPCARLEDFQPILQRVFGHRKLARSA
ncbi:MAG: phosphohydrolase [Pseudomonadota bacterium]